MSEPRHTERVSSSPRLSYEGTSALRLHRTTSPSPEILGTSDGTGRAAAATRQSCSESSSATQYQIDDSTFTSDGRLGPGTVSKTSSPLLEETEKDTASTVSDSPGSGSKVSTPTPLAGELAAQERAGLYESTVNLLNKAVRSAKPLLQETLTYTVDGSASVVTKLRRNQRIRRHLFVAMAVLILGVLPCAIYFGVVSRPFVSTGTHCGYPDYPLAQLGEGYIDYQYETMDDLQSSSASQSGIQGLFTVDRLTTKQFPLWVAKLLDTLWDLFAARGSQLISSYACYLVFNHALLRAVEEANIPYRSFIGVSITGTSVMTILDLLRECKRLPRRRLAFLFVYMAIAGSYVLAMPTLFSAMTGYISASAPFVEVGDQYVPMDNFVSASVTLNSSNSVGAGCWKVDNDWVQNYSRAMAQLQYCNYTDTDPYCASMPLDSYSQLLYCTEPAEYVIREAEKYGENGTRILDYCEHCFGKSEQVFSNGTYSLDPESYYSYDYGDSYDCSQNVTTNITGDDSSYLAFWTNYELCYDGTVRSLKWLGENLKCLPNSDQDTYQWGFSSLLTSVVLIVHAVWALSLYAAWLDAEVHSSLVREGYHLTKLRAMFAMAAAAEGTTGYSIAELRSFSPETIERKLYVKEAAIEFRIFAQELPFADASAWDEA